MDDVLACLIHWIRQGRDQSGSVERYAASSLISTFVSDGNVVVAPLHPVFCGTVAKLSMVRSMATAKWESIGTCSACWVQWTTGVWGSV